MKLYLYMCTYICVILLKSIETFLWDRLFGTSLFEGIGNIIYVLNPCNTEYIYTGRVHLHEYPSSVCLWYPGGSTKNSKLHHMIASFFFHLLPAYFIDLLMLLMGKKTLLVTVLLFVHEISIYLIMSIKILLNL